MVEYMLTDLRERLKGVGRLDVMGAVNTRAISYYAAQDELSRLPDASLERRARLLHAMGEDDSDRGAFGDAQAKFVEAHRATGAILARRPRNADSIFAHAQSEYWLGYAGWQKDDLQTAARHWSGYLGQAQALAAVEPQSRRALMELGYAHGNLCQLDLRNRRDVRRALDHCRRSVEFQRTALETTGADPRIETSLANRLGWLADALFENGDLASALRSRQEESTLLDRLVRASPRDVALRERALWPAIGIAKIEIARGLRAEGIARLRRSLAALDALGVEFPDNKAVLGRRVRVNVLLAQAVRDGGEAHWRGYRDTAAALLEAAGGRAAGLGHYYRMVESLN